MRKLHQSTSLIALFFVVFLFAQYFQETLIFSREEVSSGEIWRIWSSQFVHTNNSHLLLNILGFSLMATIYQGTYTLTQLMTYILYISTCIGLSLYFINSDIHSYAGFSGIIYGLFTLSAIQAYYRKDYLLSYPFLIITAKILWERTDSTINATSSYLINAPIAIDVHLYGFISAIFFSLITLIHFKIKKSS